jgi:hypothetical protein
MAACFQYGMPGLGITPQMSSGSMPGVNAMSVPICEVLVTSASMPDKSFVNKSNAKAFLEPGDRKDISAPALHDLSAQLTADQLANEDKHMNVTAYGCKKEAYDLNPDESMVLSKQAVVFDHGQTITFH